MGTSDARFVSLQHGRDSTISQLPDIGTAWWPTTTLPRQAAAPEQACAGGAAENHEHLEVPHGGEVESMIRHQPGLDDQHAPIGCHGLMAMRQHGRRAQHAVGDLRQVARRTACRHRKARSQSRDRGSCSAGTHPHRAGRTVTPPVRLLRQLHERAPRRLHAAEQHPGLPHIPMQGLCTGVHRGSPKSSLPTFSPTIWQTAPHPLVSPLRAGVSRRVHHDPRGFL